MIGDDGREKCICIILLSCLFARTHYYLMCGARIEIAHVRIHIIPYECRSRPVKAHLVIAKMSRSRLSKSLKCRVSDMKKFHLVIRHFPADSF